MTCGDSKDRLEIIECPEPSQVFSRRGGLLDLSIFVEYPRKKRYDVDGCVVVLRFTVFYRILMVVLGREYTAFYRISLTTAKQNSYSNFGELILDLHI